MEQAKIPTMFAGVLTPDGYRSHLEDCYDPEDGWRAYLIKGGAGMGKSTLMKRVLAAVVEQGGRARCIPCPSDPDSLDGVVFEDKKICLLDATAPHIVNSKYPVVCELLVDMAAACDPEKLRGSREAILETDRRLSGHYRRASRYLAAIRALQKDSYRVAYDACDRTRATRFAAGLADRLFPKKNGRGRETVVFLSALTPKGHLAFPDTVSLLCDRVIAVEDEYGAASRLILSTLRMAALEAGYDIVTGMCPLEPEEKVEHLLIPELRLGFVTRNRWLDLPTTERIVHVRRFEDVSALHQKRQRLSFNRRAVNELIAGTCQTLAQAKAVHDQLEALYAPAMDFARLDAIAQPILSECLKESRA